MEKELEQQILSDSNINIGSNINLNNKRKNKASNISRLSINS